MNILITDAATLKHNEDISLSVFKKYGNVDFYDCIDYNTLQKVICKYDIALTNKAVFDNVVLENAHKLKYIGLFATGYNNIDINFCREHNIMVCNAGEYSTFAVAQQVFSYILYYYNSLHTICSNVRNGDWIKSKTFSLLNVPTDELLNKTIGIVGYGSIGSRVAKIASTFGMKVLVYTRTIRNDNLVEFVDFDTLLVNSDIVTVHCPLTEKTIEMFNKSAFKKMKKNAMFINTSRGGVVNEEDLKWALISNTIAFGAVDVLQYEPMNRDCPLFGVDNIIITPHIAWAPISTRERLMGIVEDNLNAFLSNTTPKCKIC